jgi:2',3'-cyclic-nucleotide 2'-phosphodiesterase (5'-nucleotidase family)
MIEKLNILHINDLHSHFEAYPKIKRFFNSYSESDGEVLKLDIGDNVDKWHPMTEASVGKINVNLMNELGIQYATVGNNEGIGLAKSEISHIYDDANFEVILGNLGDEKGPADWASPYAIYETKLGTKIALLAYTFPYYLTYAPNGWTVTDPIDCLKRDIEISEVKNADFRILMSHLGIRVDEVVTKEVPEIDLIIGAHTHHVFEEGAQINGTYLAAAGKYGQFAGEINLSFDNHHISDIHILAHETSHMKTLREDATWVTNFEQKGRDLLAAQKIISLEKDLTIDDSCQLIMDAMLSYAKADVVIMNSGLVVSPFDKEITKDTLHHSLPHQMRLVVFEVTLSELREICQDLFSQGELLKDQEIHGMGFRGKKFGKLLTKGFAFKNGKIVYNEKVVNENGTIRLAVVDQYYFARYFETLKTKKGQLLFPSLLRELVGTYLQDKKYLQLKEEGV